jgi:hypothetical protein
MMLRVFFGVAALALCTPASFACDGQTGKVIFEDKFADDAGGWAFGEIFVLKAPGATITAAAAEAGSGAMSRLMLKSAKRASLIENLRSLRGLGKMRVR